MVMTLTYMWQQGVQNGGWKSPHPEDEHYHTKGYTPLYTTRYKLYHRVVWSESSRFVGYWESEEEIEVQRTKCKSSVAERQPITACGQVVFLDIFTHHLPIRNLGTRCLVFGGWVLVPR